MCEKPYKKLDSKLIAQNLKNMGELIYEGEETYFGEEINTPEEFIEDFCNRVNIVYSTAMEEEQEMPRLAYLIGSLIGLKSRLNRVFETL